jgi:hypothetical protein
MATYGDFSNLLDTFAKMNTAYMDANGRVMDYAKAITMIMDRDRPTATPEQLKKIDDFLDLP